MTDLLDDLGVSKAQYDALQAWFQKNPNALWAPKSRPPIELLRDAAKKGCAALELEHPTIEFDAFADALTGNLVLKAYSSATRSTQTRTFTRDDMTLWLNLDDANSIILTDAATTDIADAWREVAQAEKVAA